jgi:hypothetical protein
MNSNFKIDFSDKKTLEKYSSAFTLSDMEIFIFPDLFYPLVIADIMSPILWSWRDDPWFKDIDKILFKTMFLTSIFQHGDLLQKALKLSGSVTFLIWIY